MAHLLAPTQVPHTPTLTPPLSPRSSSSSDHDPVSPPRQFDDELSEILSVPIQAGRRGPHLKKPVTAPQKRITKIDRNMAVGGDMVGSMKRGLSRKKGRTDRMTWLRKFLTKAPLDKLRRASPDRLRSLCPLDHNMALPTPLEDTVRRGMDSLSLAAR
ncbi:hypothetical protein P7C73_g387, partial [Tremellales sp. Uapishka_1]